MSQSHQALREDGRESNSKPKRARTKRAMLRLLCAMNSCRRGLFLACIVFFALYQQWSSSKKLWISDTILYLNTIHFTPFKQLRRRRNARPAPFISMMPEKCEYSENDLQLIAAQNITIELSPTPKTEADLVALYGSSPIFRPMTSELEIWNDTIPFLNASTVAKIPPHPFHSGYRNQMMMFTTFYMKIAAAGYDQVILQSLNHVDQFNTVEREGVRHQDLFDVKHWNTFYPALPRLVHCDPKAFPEFNCTDFVEHYSHVMNEQDCVTKPYRYLPSEPNPWANFREFQVGLVILLVLKWNSRI